MVLSDDRDTLHHFNEKVLRLESTGLYRRYLQSNPEVIAIVRDAKFRNAKNGCVEFAAHFRSWLADFDQDEIDAFVLTYHLFIQVDDRLSLRQLAATYDPDWIPREAGDNFIQARKQLNEYLDNSEITVSIDGPITIRQLLDVFIYGELAHSNKSHTTTFHEWMNDGGVTGFFWAEFITALLETTRYLQYFRELKSAVLANTAHDDK